MSGYLPVLAVVINLRCYSEVGWGICLVGLISSYERKIWSQNQMHTERIFEGGDKNRKDEFTNQVVSRIAANFQKQGEKHGTVLLLEHLESNLVLDSRLSLSRTHKESLSVILRCQICDSLL